MQLRGHFRVVRGGDETTRDLIAVHNRPLGRAVYTGNKMATNGSSKVLTGGRLEGALILKFLCERFSVKHIETKLQAMFSFTRWNYTTYI